MTGYTGAEGVNSLVLLGERGRWNGYWCRGGSGPATHAYNLGQEQLVYRARILPFLPLDQLS